MEKSHLIGCPTAWPVSTSCTACGERYCSECLTSGQCSSCQENQENEDEDDNEGDQEGEGDGDGASCLVTTVADATGIDIINLLRISAPWGPGGNLCTAR